MLSELPAWTFLVALMAPTPSFVSGGLHVGLASVATRYEVASRPLACSEGSVLVDGEYCPGVDYHCIRKVEEGSASCAEYAPTPECRYNPQSRRFCIDEHEWPNRVGAQPTVFVSWHEASKSCQSIGKRLCKRPEWTLACEGPKRAPYPYGWQRFPSPCNISRPVPGVNAKRLQQAGSRDAELKRLWQGDAIGSHPNCVSAFGAFDMVGNVDEWTDNSDESSVKVSTLNGGYWGPVRNTCRLTTKTHGPEFQFYQIGFRCCSDTRDGFAAAPVSRVIERSLMSSAPESDTAGRARVALLK